MCTIAVAAASRANLLIRLHTPTTRTAAAPPCDRHFACTWTHWDLALSMAPHPRAVTTAPALCNCRGGLPPSHSLRCMACGAVARVCQHGRARTVRVCDARSGHVHREQRRLCSFAVGGHLAERAIMQSVTFAPFYAGVPYPRSLFICLLTHVFERRTLPFR